MLRAVQVRPVFVFGLPEKLLATLVESLASFSTSRHVVVGVLVLKCEPNEGALLSPKGENLHRTSRSAGCRSIGPQQLLYFQNPTWMRTERANS